MKQRSLCLSAHFTTELGAISPILHLWWDTCTHSHTTDQETHVLSLISRINAHSLSLSDTHTYTSCLSHYRSPQAQLAGWKAQFVYSCGDYGGGGRGHWNASNRAQGPLSQSSLITAPPHPPHPQRPPTPPPPGTQPQWTWARVNRTATQCVCVCVCVCALDIDRTGGRKRSLAKLPSPITLPSSSSCQGIPSSQGANTGQWNGTEPITSHHISSHQHQLITCIYTCVMNYKKLCCIRTDICAGFKRCCSFIQLQCCKNVYVLSIHEYIYNIHIFILCLHHKTSIALGPKDPV